MNISYHYEKGRCIQLKTSNGFTPGALTTNSKPYNPYLSRLTLSGLVNRSKALVIIFFDYE